MTENNYFTHEQACAIHDAHLMIESDETDYESIEDVLLGETEAFDKEAFE